MRSTHTALALLVMGGTASPLLAQGYGMGQPPAPPTSSMPAKDAAAAAAPAGPSLCSGKLGNGARKALVQLQSATSAKDPAGIATAIAAAQAAAKSPDERCVLGQLMLKDAAERNDTVAAGAAIDVMLASGVANPAVLGPLASSVGKMRYNAKDYAGASTAFDQAIKLTPNDAEAYVLSGEAKEKLSQHDAALAQFAKAFAARRTSGQPIDETWLRRAVALAYEAKSASAYTFARQWVSAYPTAKNWRDALKLYAVMSGQANSELVDVYRLQRATKGLSGESDFANYASALLGKGYPGEAQAVLAEGVAANVVNRTSASIAPLLSQATAKAVTDRAGLDALAKAAAASADGKRTMTAADAYYGYGDYAQAATLYRAALTKTGADAPTANLRLGMALTMAGDKAGAKTALSAVTGPKAELAQFWLTYLAQRA